MGPCGVYRAAVPGRRSKEPTPISVAWLLLATAVMWAVYTVTRGSDRLSWVLVAGQFLLAGLAFWMAWRDGRAHEAAESAAVRGESPSGP